MGFYVHKRVNCDCKGSPTRYCVGSFDTSRNDTVSPSNW